MNHKIDKALGHKVQEMRKRRSISREKLAKIVKVSTSLIQQYETGATKMSVTSLLVISRFLDFDMSKELEKIEKNINQSDFGESEFIDMTCSQKAFNILTIENNPMDQIIVKEASRNIGMSVEINAIEDGSKAIDLLTKSIQIGDPILPDLIFLDINLPKRNGFEVLKFIKSHDKIKSIPTIMVTTSILKKEVVKAYEYGCNSYLVKSFNSDEAQENIKIAIKYWSIITRIS